MSDKMIEQIKADRDAGTPGPWADDKKTHDQPYLSIKIGKKFHTVCTIWLDDAPIEDFNSEQEVNARRIARVPDMEARILADAKVIEAAKELADLMSIGECPWREGTREHRDFWQDRQEALADYTAALEEKNDE